MEEVFDFRLEDLLLHFLRGMHTASGIPAILLRQRRSQHRGSFLTILSSNHILETVQSSRYFLVIIIAKFFGDSF